MALRLFALDTGMAIEDEGDTFIVRLGEPESFNDVNEDLVPIGDEEGMLAQFGTTQEGTDELFALHFTKEAGWTIPRIQSFLAKGGFDHRVVGSDRRVEYVHESTRLEAGATIVEDEDFWVIKDNVLTKSGVFNGIMRPPQVFEDAFQLYEGIPVTHPHPEDIVKDMSLVGGIVRNIRLEYEGRGSDAESISIIADYALAKHVDVDGLRVNAGMVALNEETVKRLQSGKGVDNSQGYLMAIREETGEAAGKRFGGVLESLIPNHLAILLEEEGACNWRDGCGVGRRALERIAPKPLKPTQSVSNPGPPLAHEVETMGCTECTGTIEQLRKERDEAVKTSESLEALREAYAPLAEVFGLEGDATASQVIARAKEATEELKTYRKETEEAHKGLVASVVEVVATRQKDADKGALTEKYSSWPDAALLEHKGLIEAATAVKKPAKADAARPGAAPMREARLTVGIPVPGADGALEWRTG